MIPDLRPRRAYRSPLPQWLRILYFASVAVVVLSIGGGAALIVWRGQMDAAAQAVRTSTQTAVEKTQAFEKSLGSQEAAKLLRTSLQGWKNTSTPSSELEAAALLAVAQTEKALQDEDRARPAKERGKRPGTSRELPDLVMRGLRVESRHAAGLVEVTLDVGCNTDPKRVIAALSGALSRLAPAGFTLTNFKPEERTGLVHVTSTWKKAAP